MLQAFCQSDLWELFGNIFLRTFFPAKIKFPKSSLTDRKARKCARTFSEQYGATKLRTSISCCGWRTPNEVLQVPIVPHVSNSQYFLAKVLTGNYCELLTCDTMGTVVLHLECGCTTKCSQNVLRLTVLRSRTISGGFDGTFFSELFFWREEKVLRKKFPKSSHKSDWQKAC